MAESVREVLHIAFSGGSYSIAIDADRAIVREVVEAVPKGALYLGLGIGLGLGLQAGLGEIFEYVRGKAAEHILREAINRGLGGNRDDQEIRDIKPGCIHVLLHCFTDKRFLEILEDFKSERIKERLFKEFSSIGIETEGLNVKIMNMKEVEERIAAITKRNMEKTEKEKNSFTTDFEFMRPETSKDPSKVYDVGFYTNASKSGEKSDQVYIDEEELRDSKTGQGQREQKDQLKDPEMAPNAAETATTQHTNTSTSNALSELWAHLKLKPRPKYTLQQARTIHNHKLSDGQLISSDQIPDYIFDKLKIVDYNVREFKIKSVNSHSFDNNDDSGDSEDENEDEAGVNPMDAVLGIFHCSDNFLRRYLAVKLSECQLSVPFLLPNPDAPSEKVTILLSALENITKSWSSVLDNDNKCEKHVFATEHPFPVVSFIRIDQSVMSKSCLINKIMSGGSIEHKFFFHKDMEGGNVERKVVDGLVELSWYLPGGNREQLLQEEICFANLRGDARIFKIQLNVLLKISSVLCVILPSESPAENVSDILEQTTHGEAKVIVIFCEKAPGNPKPQTEEKAPKNGKECFKDFKIKHEKTFSSITKTEKTNEFDFLERIRKNIQKNLKSATKKPLVEITSCASDYGIQLDHDQTDTGFEVSANNWLKMEIQDAKNLLTLQKYIPELARLEREIHHPKCQGNKSIPEYENEMQESIRNIETTQKESAKQLDQGIISCFHSFAMMKESERNQALHMLKHQLNKMSLQVITSLYHDYRAVLFDVQKKKEVASETLNTQPPEEQHLKELEESISKFSFGLEHIIRELAQLYQIQESKYDYAGAAADMLLSGQPLEILDGDSFYIPLRWFNAVYTKLEHKTKNAKIFVISVIGIQSSGKSTMLNTMFGLEFPVSAGRCSRGVFASLLPVSDSLKTTSKFDYVLIIDTEGLRGSADPQLREHDNELATFAIGVADLTMVNIFGEDHNTMKDFLEIAVHAFLKMKLVEKKRKTSCKIVHQNVTATNASDRLVGNRLILKQELDKMTCAAGSREDGGEKFEKFNDVISFNEKEDVFYIPALLKGNPPMASVNPEYGKAVQSINGAIITSMCSKESSYHTVSQFRKRVMNLWGAILKENFIFSLRNTIEVRARVSLDKNYFKESVAIMVTGMAELEKRIVVVLKRCSTGEERETKWAHSREEISTEAENLGKKMVQAMNDFFETDEDKITLEQWKENIMTKIKREKEIHILEVTKNCLSTFTHLQRLQDVNDKKMTYEDKLLEKAKAFITSAFGNENEENLEALFEKQWQQWIESVPTCEGHKIDINKEMVNFLSIKSIDLSEEMKEKLKQRKHIITNFMKSDEKMDVGDLTYSVSTVKILKRFLEPAQQAQCLHLARKVKKSSKEKALDFAKKASKSGVRFNSNYLVQMYNIVITTIEKETQKLTFKFKNSLKCDILLETFAQAYKYFNEMEERYWEEQDIRGQMEKDLRPRLKKYFRNVCKKMGKEMLAATSFVDVLENQIESALDSSMGPVVTREISKEREFQNKGQFHARVLIQLGNEEKFDSYVPYLQNLLGFLRSKLIESIENFCLEKIPASIDSLFKNEVKNIEKEVLAAISIASNETKARSEKLEFWIKRFVEECSSFAIKKEMFSVATIEDLENIELFQVEVDKKVSNIFESLSKSSVKLETFRKWNPSPGDCLSNSMFSCICSCPFCETLCDHTGPNHDVHSAHSHRPVGIIGYKDENTRKLVTDGCTELVTGKKRFQNSDTSWDWYTYKEYRTVNDYYKSWNIRTDNNKQQKYWRWFMAKFSKELAKYHEAEEADLPRSWKRLKFDMIEKQLRDEYFL